MPRRFTGVEPFSIMPKEKRMAKQKKLASKNAKKGAATNAASVELPEIDIMKELTFENKECEETELSNLKWTL